MSGGEVGWALPMTFPVGSACVDVVLRLSPGRTSRRGVLRYSFLCLFFCCPLSRRRLLMCRHRHTCVRVWLHALMKKGHVFAFVQMCSRETRVCIGASVSSRFFRLRSMCVCSARTGGVFDFADPSMMPKMQVDRGAIGFVLRGSNIMCPGLTSPGGRMENVQPGAVVVSLFTWVAHIALFPPRLLPPPHTLRRISAPSSPSSSPSRVCCKCMCIQLLPSCLEW